MKRRIMGIIIVLIFCGVTVLNSASTPPWLGGYRLSIDGFSEISPFANDEHMGFHLFFSLTDWDFLNPFFFVGLLHPIYNSEPHTLLEAGVDLRLLVIHKHPFAGLFRRESAWTPTIQVGLISPLKELDALNLAVTLHPFSFFFGEKTISILAPRYTYQWQGGTSSWAIRLLEITQSLF